MTTTTGPAKSHSRHNYFSEKVLMDQDGFVNKAKSKLRGVDFDTFVVRGMSGAVAGGILSHAMNKNLFVVRKDSDDSHDGTRPFGNMGDRWLFLDDFISSGVTFWNVFDTITVRCTDGDDFGTFGAWKWPNGFHNPKVFVLGNLPKFVGAYLYDYEGYRSPADLTGYIGTGTAGGFEE